MSIRQYIFLRKRTTDDIRVPFPVSPHVLRVRSAPLTRASRALFPFVSVALTLVLGLSSVGVTYGKLGTTSSFFSDTEQSMGNVFVADPIDFTVTSSASSTLLSTTSPDPFVVFTVTLASSSDPIQYAVSAQYLDGNRDVCDALHVYTTAPFVYDGPLLSLTSATTTDIGSWTMNISALTTALPANAQCTVRLIYSAENIGVAPGQGFHVIKTIESTFIAPDAPVVPDAPIPQETNTPPADTSSQQGTGEGEPML